LVIVLIHWRIKPTAEAEAAFFDFWTKTAKIENKEGLAGEFLSAPLPANQFPYRVDDLSIGSGDLDCKHYINVGFWKDSDSFHAEVGKYMSDDKPLKPFEADHRTRTVLEPRQWRMGDFALPEASSCE